MSVRASVKRANKRRRSRKAPSSLCEKDRNDIPSMYTAVSHGLLRLVEAGRCLTAPAAPL